MAAARQLHLSARQAAAEAEETPEVAAARQLHLSALQAEAEETPEVAAARQLHLSALQEAQRTITLEVMRQSGALEETKRSSASDLGLQANVAENS